MCYLVFGDVIEKLEVLKKHHLINTTNINTTNRVIIEEHIVEVFFVEKTHGK